MNNIIILEFELNRTVDLSVNGCKLSFVLQECHKHARNNVLSIIQRIVEERLDISRYSPDLGYHHKGGRT